MAFHLNSRRRLVETSPSPTTSQESQHKNIIKSQQATSKFLTSNDTTLKRLFALIIGINIYEDTHVPCLHAAVHDANNVKKFLILELHVSEERIRILRNKEATRKAIIKAMEGLADEDRINPQDPILIYYAGHGSEVKAPANWPTNSENGKIQMLLPYDFKSGGSEEIQGQGILDIEISQLLAKIARAKSNNITVIFDCCHSASGTRDLNNNTLVRRTNLPEGYAIPQNLFSSADFEKGHLNSHVLLAACKHNQLASESHSHGHFTQALLDFLSTEDINQLTYTTLITSLPKFSSTQHPQCEGVHQNRIIFTSKHNGPQPAIYQIRSELGKPNEYTLEAGEAHGIVNGATLTIYSDDLLTRVVGSVVVHNATDAFTSQCSAPAGAPLLNLPQPAYAVQTLRAEGQYLRLFIAQSDPCYNQLKKLIENTEATMHSINIMDAGTEADLAISTDGHLVRFEVKNKICCENDLTCMPFDKVQVDPPEDLLLILRSAADFYCHLDPRHSNQGRSLAQVVNVECRKLSCEVAENWGEILIPKGEDLNINGTICIDVGNEPERYGYTINNLSPRPLYAALIFFNVSNLSIVSYYMPANAADGQADYSLPTNKSLNIGFGDGGWKPRVYYLEDGQTVNVGFLKVYISTVHVDYSGILQESPFDSRFPRSEKEYQRRAQSKLWGAQTITVIQKERKRKQIAES